MFAFDKDMERLMLAKKKEVLQQIEAAKKRVLEELYCVKRSVHTDLCEMLADYNRIQFALDELVAEIRREAKSTVDTYKDILAEQLTHYNQQIDGKVNLFEQFVVTSVDTIEAALAELETMHTTVADLLARVEEIAGNCASASDLEQLRADFDEAIANIDLSAFKAEIMSEIVQSDWNEGDAESKAHVLHRTHYGHVERSFVYERKLLKELDLISARKYSTATHVFKLGAALPETELSSLSVVIEFYNSGNLDGTIKATLDAHIRSIAIRNTTLYEYDYMGIPSFKIIEGYDLVENAIVYGCEGRSTTLLDENDPVCIYKDPRSNEWFIAIYRPTSLPIGQDTLTIEAASFSSVEKMLHPSFMGEGGDGVLVRTGANVEWRKMSGISHTYTTVETILDETFAFASSFTNSKGYTLDNSPIDAFVVGEEYYVSFGGVTVIYQCDNQKNLHLKSQEALAGGLKIDGGKLTAYMHNDYQIFNPGWETSIHVVVKKYKTITQTEPMTLTSPNGNKFEITVSDSGELSASPVTI